MAYRRRKVFKRKRFARKRGGLVKKVLQIVKNQRETKREQVSLANSAITYTATLAQLISVAQGATNSTRVGDEITFKNLTGRFCLTWNNVGITTQKMRVVVIYWRVPNLQTITATDIFASNGTTQAYLSPKAWTSRFNSTLLYDRVHTVDNLTNQTKNFHINIKVNKEIQFGAGTTTFQRNGLYIYFVSDQATNGPYIQGIWVNTFTDA